MQPELRHTEESPTPEAGEVHIKVGLSLSREQLHDIFAKHEEQALLDGITAKREKLRRNLASCWDRYTDSFKVQSSLKNFSFPGLFKFYLKLRKALAHQGVLPSGRKANTAEEFDQLKGELRETKADWVLTKLAAFLPKGLGLERPGQGFSPRTGFIEKVKSRTRRDIVESQERLKRVAGVQAQSHKSRLTFFIKVERAVVAAENSSLFEEGIFDDFKDRIPALFNIDELCREILESLDGPDLRGRSRKMLKQAWEIYKELDSVDMILEELSGAMLNEYHLSEQDKREAARIAASRTEALFSEGQQNLYEPDCSTLELVVRFIRIDDALRALAGSDDESPAIVILQEAKGTYLKDLLDHSPAEVEQAVLSSGAALHRFGRSLQEAVGQIRLERAAKTEREGGGAAEKKKVSKRPGSCIDAPLASYLFSHYQLGQKAARKIASHITLHRFVEVEEELRQRFGNSVQVLVRRQPNLLYLSEDKFRRGLDSIDRLLLKRQQLDPNGAIRSLDPHRAIESYLPRKFECTRKRLEDLERAKSLIVGPYSNGKPDAGDSLWLEFVTGIAQVWNAEKGETVDAHDTAQKMLEVVFPNNFIPELTRGATRTLAVVLSANALDQIRRLPGNKLQRLIGTKEKPLSVRINDLWRVMFQFIDNRAADVRLENYH